MKSGYWIIGGVTVVGAVAHYLMRALFPGEATALAGTLMWTLLGVLHLLIYWLQTQGEPSIARIVVIPAAIRLVGLPVMLVSILLIFEPEVKAFSLMFVGAALLFMGVEVGLLLRNLRLR